MRRWLNGSLVLLALSSMATTAPNCTPKECTLVGYESGLVLFIENPTTFGTYRFEAAADDEVLALNLEVSPGIDGVSRSTVECVGDCLVTGERIQIRPSFSSRPTSTFAIAISRMKDGSQPRTIGVRLLLGDKLVAENEYKPNYAVSEPNGPGCGEQIYASAELETP